MQLAKIKIILRFSSISAVYWFIYNGKDALHIYILLSPVEVRLIDHTHFLGQQDLDSKKLENRTHK